MEKNNIKKIKSIGYKSIISSSLNYTKEELLDIIKNITTQEEVDAIPNCLIKILDSDLIMGLVENKNINGNSVFSLMSKERINSILTNKQKYIKHVEIIKNISAKQISEYDGKNIINIFLNDDRTINKEIVNSLDDSAINQLLLRLDKINVNNILNILDEEKIKNIEPNILIKLGENLNDNVLKNMTLEQFNAINNEKIIKNLIKNKKLQILNNEVLENLNFGFNNYNGIFTGGIKKLTFGLCFRNLSRTEMLDQLELLKDKLCLIFKEEELLNKEFYKFIDETNINNFNDSQLKSIYENIDLLDEKTLQSITNENLLKIEDYNKIEHILTEEQFVLLFKNNKLKSFNREKLKQMFSVYMTKELFDSFSTEEINDNINSIDNFLDIFSREIVMEIKLENISNIDREMAQQIVNSNNFDKLSNEVKDYIINNFKGINIKPRNLNGLLINRDIALRARTIASINKDSINHLSGEAIDNLISAQIETGENKIEEPIVKPVFVNRKPVISNKTLRENIIDSLRIQDFENFSINCFRNNGNNVLNILKNISNRNNFYGTIDIIEILKNTVVLKDNSENEYNRLVQEIKNLCITTPESIDGYFSKSECLNRLVEENSLNSDLLEKIAEESIINVRKCIGKYYNTMERNSLDNDMREFYATTLLNYSNLLLKKYNINEKDLVEKIENNKTSLNREERRYLEAVKEAYDIKPDATTKVKSYVTPALSIIAKTGIGYYISKKIKNATNSTALSVAVAAGTAVSVVVDAKHILERNEFFSDRQKFHKKELEKKEGFFSRFCKRVKNATVGIVVSSFKKSLAKRKIKNGEPVEGIFGYTNEENKLNYKVFRNNAVQTQNTKIEKYNDKQNKKINKNIIRKYTENENKHVKLINSVMEVKENALKVRYNRNLEKIYEEFPELRQNKINLNSIISGLLSSLVDVATVGYGPALYNCFCGNKKDRENELKYRQCLEKLDILYNEFKKDKEALIEEHANRLLGLNQEDKEEIISYKAKNRINTLENPSEEYIITEIYNNFGPLNGYRKVKNIKREINPENTLLRPLMSLNDKNIQYASDCVMTLILDNNIDERVKLINMNCFLNTVTKLKDSGKIITKHQDKIIPIFIACNCIGDQKLIDTTNNNFEENIRHNVENRYRKKIIVGKRSMQNDIGNSLLCVC